MVDTVDVKKWTLNMARESTEESRKKKKFSHIKKPAGDAFLRAILLKNTLQCLIFFYQSNMSTFDFDRAQR